MAKTDVYELGFDVDARGLAKGKKELKKVGDAAVKTGAQTEKFGEKAKKSFRKTGNEAERMGRKSGRAFRGMATALTGVLGVYAAFGTVRGIVRTTAEFENFNTTLEVITGSAENAASAFNLVQKFAKETPFQLREVLAMFVRLKNAGLEPTAELLQTITDTASVTMDPTRAWEVITKVIARGTAGPLQLEDLEMLQNLGLGYVPIFQTKLGLDRQEIAIFTQEAENGKIAVEAMLEGFQEMYGGAGLRKMRSLTGTWSNLNDQIAKVQAAVGEGMRTELVKTSEDMQAMLVDNREGFVALGEELGEIVGYFNTLMKLAAENPEKAGMIGKLLFGTLALWAGSGLAAGAIRNTLFLTRGVTSFAMSAPQAATKVAKLATNIRGIGPAAGPAGVAISLFGSKSLAMKDDIEEAIGDSISLWETFSYSLQGLFATLGDEAEGLTGKLKTVIKTLADSRLGGWLRDMLPSWGNTPGTRPTGRGFTATPGSSPMGQVWHRRLAVGQRSRVGMPGAPTWDDFNDRWDALMANQAGMPGAPSWSRRRVANALSPFGGPGRHIDAGYNRMGMWDAYAIDAAINARGFGSPMANMTGVGGPGATGTMSKGVGGTGLLTARPWQGDENIFMDQLDKSTTEMWRSLVDGSKDTLTAFKDFKRELRNEFKVEALERLISRPFKRVLSGLMDDMLNSLVGDGFGSDKANSNAGLVGDFFSAITFHEGGVVPGIRRNSGGTDGMGGVLINAKPGEVVIDPEKTKVSMANGSGGKVRIELDVQKNMEVRTEQGTDDQGDFLKIGVENVILGDLVRDGPISRGLKVAGGFASRPFAGAV